MTINLFVLPIGRFLSLTQKYGGRLCHLFFLLLSTVASSALQQCCTCVRDGGPCSPDWSRSVRTVSVKAKWLPAEKVLTEGKSVQSMTRLSDHLQGVHHIPPDRASFC